MSKSLPLGSLLCVTMAQYRTTRRGNLLRHPIRRRIQELVTQHPGISLSDLRKEVGCSWGTLHHHVRLLERSDMLASQAAGRSRHLFPHDMQADSRGGIALLRRGRVMELVNAVILSPGASQVELTGAIDISRKVLRTYMDELLEQGLIVETREGPGLSYHATPALEAAVGSVMPVVA